MKKRVLDKIGTILTTVGSFGVGYYVAMFHLITDPTLFNMLGYKDQLKVIGSVILFVVGVSIRWHDIIRTKNEKQVLVGEVSQVEFEHNITEHALHRLEDQLNNQEKIVDASLKKIVETALPGLIEEYLAEREETNKEMDELLDVGENFSPKVQPTEKLSR